MTERDGRQEARSPGAGSGADSGKDIRADLGVLLVHGIGQNRSGDTLVRFGEPLVKWIVDWVGVAASAEAQVFDAVLGVEAEDPTEPAQARMRVTAPAPDGSGQRESEWLIAESWWAESFVAPTFAELTNWGFKIVPWTLFYHFHRRFMRASAAWRAAWGESPRKPRTTVARAGSLLLELFGLVLALLLAPLLVAALGFLLVLGLIPIPRLRHFVAWLQRGLALTVGDSYALLGPNIGSAAIYGRVARDLKWLAQRSKKIAVIAHSQGAAVAYRVVSRDQSGQCGLLVTFGAGLRKLAQIRLLERLSGGWVWWVSLALVSFVVSVLVSRTTLGIWRGLLLTLLVPAVMFGAAFLVGLLAGVGMRLVGHVLRKEVKVGALFASQQSKVLLGLFMIAATTAGFAWLLPGPSWKVTAWVVFLVSLSWSWMIMAFKQAGADVQRIAVMSAPESGRARPATEEALPDSVRWIDLYSGSDPVPNGAIFDGQTIDPLELRAQVPGLESFEVRNRDSMISDHTSYWKNPEGFVAPVVGSLGDLCGLKLDAVFSLDRERLIVARHRRAWRVRCLQRARLGVIATALGVWWLGNIEPLTVQLFNGLLDALRAIPGLGALLGSALPAEAAATSLTEAVAVALGGTLAYGLVHLGWMRWDSMDRSALVGRNRYPVSKDRSQPALLFNFSWMLGVATGAFLVLGWTTWPWWTYLLALAALYLIAGTVSRIGRYQGEIVDTWPEVLRRLGLWSEKSTEGWSQTVRAGAIALIDPITLPDGHSAWQAGVALVWHPESHALTTWLETHNAATLDAAVTWSLEHVERVFAATADRGYLPVTQLLAGALDPQPAVAFWTRVLERPGISPSQRSEAHLHRGQRATELGHGDEALTDFTAVIDIVETPARTRAIALNQRGHHYRDRGETERALADYTSVIETPEAPFEELAQAHANRGWLAYRAKDLQTFLTETTQAAERDPSHLMIAFNLALARLLNGETTAALDIYGKLAPQCSDPDLIQAAIQDIDEAPDLEATPDTSPEIIALLESRLNELSPEKSSEAAAD